MRPGQHIGKYVLGEPIARGGMAEVWGARVEGPQGFVKEVALKFVLESFRGDSELERLFVNEARLAAQLQHANLVSVFDFDKIPDPDGGAVGRYYIAMERVDGHDLRRVIQSAQHRGQRLPPPVALFIAGEVLKGLRHVHEKREPDTQRTLGLIHRDVSPHNILIGFAGEVKLSDFGIAKAMTQNLGTKSGMVRGKLAYASPEQLRAEVIDHRTDQFALGTTLWEALVGQRLFDGNDELAIMAKVLSGMISPLPAGLGLSAAAEAMLFRMLSPVADERYATTAEALATLIRLPEYTSDGTVLTNFLSDLFHPDVGDMPRTAQMEAVVPPAEPPLPALRGGYTLRHDALRETSPVAADAGEVRGSDSFAGGAGREGSGRAALGRTPSGAVASASRSGRASRASEVEGIVGAVGHTRPIERSGAVTGSAYVSGPVANETVRVTGARPSTWIALGVVAAGVLVVVLVWVGGGFVHTSGTAAGGRVDNPERSRRTELGDERPAPRETHPDRMAAEESARRAEAARAEAARAEAARAEAARAEAARAAQKEPVEEPESDSDSDRSLGGARPKDARMRPGRPTQHVRRVVPIARAPEPPSPPSELRPPKLIREPEPAPRPYVPVPQRPTSIGESPAPPSNAGPSEKPGPVKSDNGSPIIK